jgi:ADP-heptose:LPS heptosyltransferase
VPDVVLALRPRALGDVVLTTPALRALHRGHPDATLEVVTDARYAPLLEGLEGIARVWPMPRTALEMARFVAHQRGRRHRAVVDFFGNPRTALLTAALGARVRVGYDLRGRRWAYGVRVARTRPPAPGRREHATATHVRLALAAGGVAGDLAPRIVVPAPARAAAEDLLARAGVAEPSRTVGLVAAGTWATKTWPVSHAAVLARRLIESGWPVLVLAGPGEERVAATLARFAPGVPVLPHCDVPALAAVIARLAAVVGTDSGPRHLASALDIPTFAWFGPTHPETWSPPGDRHAHWWAEVPCRGCDRTRCPHWTCMPSLDPDTAARLVRAHLEAHARTAPALRTAAGA